MKEPVLMAEHSLGGGTWRLKWHPDPSTSLLLAGCMDAGSHILNLEHLTSSNNDKKTEKSRDGKGKSGILTTSYLHHKSLAYGCDWGQHPALYNQIVSCSFYDKSLRMWNARRP